jgi:hypothetical protein
MNNDQKENANACRRRLFGSLVSCLRAAAQAAFHPATCIMSDFKNGGEDGAASGSAVPQAVAADILLLPKLQRGLKWRREHHGRHGLCGRDKGHQAATFSNQGRNS